MRTQQGNFLVSVNIGKDADVDFNIVSSVFGKGDSKIVDWINRGLATYINKEKALTFLSHLSAPIAATAANAELSTATNIVRNFQNPNIDNGNFRYNAAEEISQSHERVTLPTAVQERIEAMHLGGEVEVVADGSKYDGKKRTAKGSFNKQTGKITIILGNHTSVEDVMQTLMHEAVAHKGLRKLFGKDFNTFLDKVFAGAEKPIREKIVALAAKNGWNIRTATEEYLASLAEDKETFEKHGGFWEKVRNFFHEMAHKLFPKLVKIGDNEMRYELWRSYENLKNDSSLIAEAKDIAMQIKLKVGKYERTFERG